MTEQELEELLVKTCRQIVKEVMPELQQQPEDAKEKNKNGARGLMQMIAEPQPPHGDKEAYLVAVAGAKAGIGVTLHCVAFAKGLLKAGYRTAIIDTSESQELKEAEDIPVYPEGDMMILDQIAFDYDIIILDMGQYEPEMQKYFNRMDKKIIITGAAPWELDKINQIFAPEAEDYLFIFNHVGASNQETIRSNMQPLKVAFSPVLAPDTDTAELMAEVFPKYTAADSEKPGKSKKGFRRKKVC